MEAGEWPRDAAARLGIPEKRKMYICEKWIRQGKYECGVATDLGWAFSEESQAGMKRWRASMGYSR